MSAMGTEAGDTAVDEALIKARSVMAAGFLVLWDALQPRLLRYLRVVGCDDVDDVAGETWLQVVRDLAKFKKDSADESAPGCSRSPGTGRSTPRGPGSGSATRC